MSKALFKFTALAAITVAGAAVTMRSALAAPTDWTVYLTHAGPLKIGMSAADVRKALDDPGAQVENPVDDPEDCGYMSSRKLPEKVTLMFTNYHLVRIEVENPAIRTASGAGVGDTEDKIKRLYAGHIEAEPHPYLLDEGGYLRYIPTNDHAFELLFETEHGTVTSFRTGEKGPVEFIEGCL